MRMDAIANAGVIAGTIIMIGVAWICAADEGPGQFLSHQNRIIARWIFQLGVAVAIVIPTITTGADYWVKWKTSRRTKH